MHARSSSAHTAEPALLRNFIDGRLVDGGGRLFDDLHPATGHLVARVQEASKDDVDRAVTAARAAMRGPWGKTSPAERAQLLHKVADEIERRFDAFLAAEMADTGKPVSLASHIDIPRGAANFRIFADIVKNASTETFEMATPDGRGALNYALRLPIGVVGVICPWNLPLLLMTWKVAPALAAGNTVVVKPSEETPATATLLGEVMNAVGVPPGVYNVVHGFGPNSAGEFLAAHPDVNALTFTGETATGAAIMRHAATYVRPVSMELGGKNPALVFADCDIDAAIAGTLRSCFANTGQVCLGTERVYVERPIFDRFVETLAKRAAALKLGDPSDSTTTTGPLISCEHRDKVLGFYAQARADGAEIHIGGGVPDMPGAFAAGAWIQPTVWTGLDHRSRVVRDEIFGPCCAVMPFDAEDEAVAAANDTEYGLCTSIWTRDLTRAHRVARQVEVGLTWVNEWFLRDLRTPFGGSKRSGIGREGGLHSLEFYTELRNVCVKL
jgi:aminomuconate-semialdehyde/2-hydroxymuconate-6-semialdehyde dehydrogenase